MQLVLFCGIQATGKSTFYQQRFFHSHVRISLDLLRTRHRERLLLELCLETQMQCVVDNTNPTRVGAGQLPGCGSGRGFRSGWILFLVGSGAGAGAQPAAACGAAGTR